MACRTEDLLRRHKRFLPERAVLEVNWREIAKRDSPRSYFLAGRRTSGEKNAELLFDATISSNQILSGI
jgi:hypothetical protein